MLRIFNDTHYRIQLTLCTIHSYLINFETIEAKGTSLKKRSCSVTR